MTTLLLKLLQAINGARRALYRAGVLKPKKLPVPVISVGNIAMGGGGKTPTVIAIARFLLSRGFKVGVLTRGYGRSGVGGVVIAPDTERFGDEPVLIKLSDFNITVIVGKKRYDNAVMNPCDVYILDDGFQHLQLHRDLDIVVDVPDARFMRESRSALRYADVVIPRRLKLTLPDELRGKRLFAFSGLANNEQFFEALRAEGADLVGTRGFPDHHRYTAQDIAEIRKADADAIVTTEKDGVKVLDPTITAIHAEMIIDPEVFERVLRAVKR